MTTAKVIVYEKLCIVFCLFAGLVFMQKYKDTAKEDHDHNNCKRQYCAQNHFARHFNTSACGLGEAYGKTIGINPNATIKNEQYGQNFGKLKQNGRINNSRLPYRAARENNCLTGSTYRVVPHEGNENPGRNHYSAKGVAVLVENVALVRVRHYRSFSASKYLKNHVNSYTIIE